MASSAPLAVLSATVRTAMVRKVALFHSHAIPSPMSRRRFIGDCRGEREVGERNAISVALITNEIASNVRGTLGPKTKRSPPSGGPISCVALSWLVNNRELPAGRRSGLRSWGSSPIAALS